MVSASGGYAAYPPSFAHQREVNEAVVQRTAASLPVDDLNLHECHVGTVGLHAFGVLDGGQSQLVRFSGCFQFITAAVGTDSLERAGFKADAVEGVQVVIVAPARAKAAAVEEQFHAVGGRNDIDGLF